MMFGNMFNRSIRKKFSIRRNATKRWKQALSGASPNSPNVSKCKSSEEPFSVIIKATSMNLDQQKQAVEIANMALDTCNMESEIATFIKTRMDELTGKTWHVIVGRNFGSHITWEQYVQFTASKIMILVYQCG